MRIALLVAAKELRQRLRDRSALVIAFVAPTLLAAIVTGAFGAGFGPGSFDTVVAVVDHDGGEISRALVGDVLGSEELSEIITVREVGSEDEALALLERQEVLGVYVIPQGFGDDVAAGRRAEIGVVRDAQNPVTGEIVEAVARGFADQVNATRLSVFTALRASGGDLEGVEELAAAAAALRMPVQLVQRDPALREVSGANYFGPAMAILFLFFTVGAGARSLYTERAQGTLPRVLAAPGGPGAVVLGKSAAMFVLGLGSMCSVYLSMGLLFGVQWGDPLAIAALTLGAVVSVMALVAVVQTFARTEQQAASYGQVVGIGFALLGGNFFPLFMLPEVMQRISALTPNGWALRGFTDVAYDGATLFDLGPNLAAMGAFAAVCGTVATLRARRISVAA